MIDILMNYKDRLQHELAVQCVNDTESILHDRDWWGGLDLPEGHAFDFNVYEVSHTDVDGALKAVAYYCDEKDDLGLPRSSYAHSIDLEVPQFLKDQYQLRKSSEKKTRKVITGYDLVARWNDGETQIVDIPNHIANDIDYLLTQLEDEENE